MLKAKGYVCLWSCHDALLANELLAERDIGLKVVNLPWLNRVDIKWLKKAIEPYNLVFVLENHRPAGALAEPIFDLLSASRNQPLARRHLERFAVEGWPVCGSPQEVLKFHKLDGASLAERVFEYIDIVLNDFWPQCKSLSIESQIIIIGVNFVL